MQDSKFPTLPSSLCLRPPCLETHLSHVLTSMSKVPFRLTISGIRYRENRRRCHLEEQLCCALVWRTDFNDNVLLKNILCSILLFIVRYRYFNLFVRENFLINFSSFYRAIFFYFFGNDFIILKK